MATAPNSPREISLGLTDLYDPIQTDIASKSKVRQQVSRVSVMAASITSITGPNREDCKPVQAGRAR